MKGVLQGSVFGPSLSQLTKNGLTQEVFVCLFRNNISNFLESFCCCFRFAVCKFKLDSESSFSIWTCRSTVIVLF